MNRFSIIALTLLVSVLGVNVASAQSWTNVTQPCTKSHRPAASVARRSEFWLIGPGWRTKPLVHPDPGQHRQLR